MRSPGSNPAEGKFPNRKKLVVNLSDDVGSRTLWLRGRITGLDTWSLMKNDGQGSRGIGTGGLTI